MIALGTNLFCLSLDLLDILAKYSTNTSCVCQVAGISKRSNDKQKSFVRNAIILQLLLQLTSRM